MSDVVIFHSFFIGHLSIYGLPQGNCMTNYIYVKDTKHNTDLTQNTLIHNANITILESHYLQECIYDNCTVHSI